VRRQCRGQPARPRARGRRGAVDRWAQRAESASRPCQPPLRGQSREPAVADDLRRQGDAGLRRRDRRRRMRHPRRHRPARGGARSVGRGELMDPSIALLTIFVLAVFTGYEVVSKVSSTLHTPLMSGANAIHGIILVGAVIVAGQADGAGELIVGLVAVVLATLNLVGGFVVTDRMLEMFRAKKAPQQVEAGGAE